MRTSWMASLAALVATSAPALAQEPVVHGVVRDAQTGKPVPGVSVYNQETDEVAITDDAGAFTFAPGPGNVHLTVVDPAYQRADARGDGDHEVEIKLEPLSLRGEEIVIEADREHTSAGETNLRRDEITHMAGARGDALAAVKNLPGVANVQGFGPAAGLVIRGSSPSDSRIFVDGFEIPILYHLGGIQSVMPSEMIDDLEYSPGAFGVEWGKASGGIINVTSRKGGRDLAGFAEVSFINAQVMLQGPLGKKGSFALAGRRSYIDAVIPLAVGNSADLSFTALPRYYDYQARADYELSPHLKLTGFLFGSDDVFAIASDTDNPDDPAASGRFANTTRFTRAIASATYDRPGVYNKLGVSGLAQRETFDVGTDRFIRVNVQSLTLRDEAKLAVGQRVSLIAGGQAELLEFKTRVKLPRPPHEGDPQQPNFTYDPIIDAQQDDNASNLAAWTAAEVTPVAALKVTGGVRVDNFRWNNAVAVQPRGQARLALSKQTALLAASGLYTRPPDNQDENLQKSLAPERAWQTSLGVENKVAPGVTLQTTAYYIDRSDLIVQAAGNRAGAMDPSGQDTYANDGIGRSYGAELLLQARTDRFFGWAAYTFARSERRDHEMSDWRKFDSDQTHNLVVLGSLKLGARRQWQLGGRFQYTSGQPYTPVAGATFDSDRNSYVPDYGRVNSLRSRAQHQLDLRVDRVWTFRDWKLSGYLDVSNVYLNAPVIQYSYNANYTKRTEVTGIPILPSIGIRGEF